MTGKILNLPGAALGPPRAKPAATMQGNPKAAGANADAPERQAQRDAQRGARVRSTGSDAPEAQAKRDAQRGTRVRGGGQEQQAADPRATRKLEPTTKPGMKPEPMVNSIKPGAPEPTGKPGKPVTAEPVQKPNPDIRPQRLRADELDRTGGGNTATERAVAQALERIEDTHAGRAVAAQLREDEVTIDVVDDPDVFGGYRAEPSTISINIDVLQDADTLVRVLAHEARHHEQNALDIDDDLNEAVGDGSGEGSDRSDGVEADATFTAVRVAQELGIELNDDEAQALRPDGSERTLQELVDLRRAGRK